MSKISGVSRNEHYNRGIALYDSGLYAEAIAEFEQVVGSTSEDAVPERKLASFYMCEAYANLGLAHLRSSMYARAEDEFKFALSIHPEYADLHYQIGVVYYKEGKYVKAESELREAIKVNPKFAKAMLYMGIVRLQLGHDDGLKYINSAVKLQPAYGGYRIERVMDLFGSGQAQEAFRLVEELAEVDVDHVGYMLEKGLRLMQRKAYLEASHTFLEAISICPHYPDLRHYLGTCYVQLGRTDLAIVQYSKALDTNPFFTEARLSLAAAYEQDGRPDLALREVDHILYLEPDNLAANHVLERLQEGGASENAA